MLRFGVLIAFLSPKQSEIEESSLESLSKSRIRGVCDPTHSTREGITSGYRHFTLECITSGCHHIPSGCRHFTPGCITSENLLSPPFNPNVLHPEFRSRMGEEGVSTPPDRHIRIRYSAHPEDFVANFAQYRGILLKLPNMCNRHL